MGNDKLMEALIRTARRREEQDASHPGAVWEQLSEGKPVIVPAGKTDDSEAQEQDAEELKEVYRPLGRDFRAAVVERAWAELGGGKDSSMQTEATAKIVALKPGFSSRRTWVGLSLAASLLLALVVVMDLGPGVGEAQLPGYALSLDGGLTRMRSSTVDTGVSAAGARPVEYAQGNQFRILLTPDAAVDGPVAVRVFVQKDGLLARLDTPPAGISAKGAIAVNGDVGADVQLPPGASSLIVVVGRPDAMPGVEDLSEALASASPGALRGQGWTAWRNAISMQP